VTKLVCLCRRHAKEAPGCDAKELDQRRLLAHAAEDGRRCRQVRVRAGQVLARLPVGRQGEALHVHRRRVRGAARLRRRREGCQLQAQGDGRGRSRQPRARGIASGDEFVMAYPLPFLEYYYFANRSELPEALRAKVFGEVVAAADGVGGVGAAAIDGAQTYGESMRHLFMNGVPNRGSEPGNLIMIRMVGACILIVISFPTSLFECLFTSSNLQHMSRSGVRCVEQLLTPQSLAHRYSRPLWVI
jgi:hypothetical protein